MSFQEQASLQRSNILQAKLMCKVLKLSLPSFGKVKIFRGRICRREPSPVQAQDQAPHFLQPFSVNCKPWAKAAMRAGRESPQENQVEAARNLGKIFLTLYEELHELSLLDARKLFNKVHKHHSMQHMVHSASDKNTRYAWNFRAEDFVGCMATLAHRHPLV